MNARASLMGIGLILALSGPVVAVDPSLSTTAISPDRPMKLFNGRDLSGWTTWLRSTGRRDPDRVYSVTKGAIHISGRGTGYLATVDTYRDYRLRFEYRWGDRTDGSKYVRNSGVLLHAVGPDGNAKHNWMASIECQLAQGCEGDLIVIRGRGADGTEYPVTLTSNTTTAADGKTRWDPAGTKTVYAGKQFWWSQHQIGFKELLDTRGAHDVASPRGAWTRVECICNGRCITIKINGVTVNACRDVWPDGGKILLECEGNEILFRHITLCPLSSYGERSPRTTNQRR